MDALRQVSSPLVLFPAYGARYATAEAMRKAWNAGEYFGFSLSGPYTSVRDFQQLFLDSSSISLYDARTKITVRVA